MLKETGSPRLRDDPQGSHSFCRSRRLVKRTKSRKPRADQPQMSWKTCGRPRVFPKPEWSETLS